jgi:hypothetical protein
MDSYEKMRRMRQVSEELKKFNYGMSSDEAVKQAEEMIEGKKGKGGKGKDHDKGKGRGSKRTYDNTVTTLSTFASSSSDQPAKRPRVTSNTTPQITADHNPSKPYCYCWFHGWNFSHAGTSCKRILKSNDPLRINSTSPTSTTPPGNAYVEPAYKSWWI